MRTLYVRILVASDTDSVGIIVKDLPRLKQALEDVYHSDIENKI